jgi:hypothetical protein
MTKEVKAVQRWLKKPGNTEAKLAGAMGYESSVSVKNWVKRGNVPTYMRDKLSDFLTQEEEK